MMGLACFVFSAGAQEVSIPDPGLNAAIRDALQKPAGPLAAQDLLNLTSLLAGHRNIRSVEGLEAARNLRILDLDGNSLTNFPIADALTNLTILDLFGNNLDAFVLTNALPNLTILDIAFNSLTQCSIPAGLRKLDTLFLESNALANLYLPGDLTVLRQLDLSGNQLTELTLPPDVTKLTSLFVDGNPLTTFVLSEPLAATNLATTVATLQNDGVNVFPYPLTIQLLRPRPLVGAFQFGITGPPGSYGVFASSDLAAWSEVGIASNLVGSISFVDVTTNAFPPRYYRALRR